MSTIVLLMVVVVLDCPPIRQQQRLLVVLVVLPPFVCVHFVVAAVVADDGAVASLNWQQQAKLDRLSVVLPPIQMFVGKVYNPSTSVTIVVVVAAVGTVVVRALVRVVVFA